MRAFRLPRLAPALALLLAGCAATVPADDAPQAGAAFVVEGERCRELVVAVPLPREAAQTLLPGGWTASDAGVLFGVPVASGRGLVAFAAFDCAAGNLTRGDARERVLFHWGELVVLVEPPEGAPEAALHAYEPMLAHNDRALGAAFAAWGWEAAEGNVARQTERAPVGGPVAFDQAWRAGEHDYRGRGVYHVPDAAGSPTVTRIYQGDAAAPRVLLFEGDFAVGPPGPATFEAAPGTPLAAAAGSGGPAVSLYVTSSTTTVRPEAP